MNIDELFSVIYKRVKNKTKNSYTNKLLSLGPKKIAQKLFDDIMLFASYGFNKSHAVAYAIDSYYCAWLMTYYEEEWLCAYLESMEGNPDKRGKAFSEVQTLGYEIVPIDINYADKNWTILKGKKFMLSLIHI